MKIKRFIGRSVNGHLNFDIRFLDHVTFVTGINGSGKTSALNSIAALLLPRLDYLAEEYFEIISIELLNNLETVHLTAKKVDTTTVLACSQFPNDEFPIVRYEPPEPYPSHRVRELEEEHYQEFLARSGEHPIIGYIQSLPTPMYLGLDRRSLSFTRERPRYGGSRQTVRRGASRSIFGRSLEVGLAESLHYARDHMQEVRVREVKLDAQVREKIVLELIDFPPISVSDRAFEAPSSADLEKFEEAKSNLSRLPNLLRVPESTISSRIDPIINFLNATLQKMQRSKSKRAADEFAFIEWSFNKTNLDKLSLLSEIISNHNNEVDSIRKRISNYLETVNEFLRDSGKQVIFNNIGELRFVLAKDEAKEQYHINSLSSGEIQMVVILTHLYFNPEVEKANVFIIDEPELSLHVQWQEKFVDRIIEASNETQFILATHSPTIILDKRDFCREISQV